MYVVTFSRPACHVSVAVSVTSFVGSPGQDDLSLALQFFPLRDTCNIDEYGAPAFPMANVLMSQADIGATLNSRRMSGGTPIVQA